MLRFVIDATALALIAGAAASDVADPRVLDVSETAMSTALAEDDVCSNNGGETDCGLNALQHSMRGSAAVEPAHKQSAQPAGETQGNAEQFPDWIRQGIAQIASAANSSSLYGTVDELYTFGAPGTATPPLEDLHNPDHNFRGLRIYTEDIWGAARESKWIDAAAIFNNLEHAKMPTVVLRWNEDSAYVGGAGRVDWPMYGTAVYAHWPLHGESNYADRLAKIKVNGTDASGSLQFQRARLFSRLAFKSYDSTVNTKKALASEFPDWKVVAHEVLVTGKNGLRDEDPVWLMQQQKSLECALVFTGTNGGAEFSTSTKTTKAFFCGFFGVHQGYRDELWHITKYLIPELRTKLSKCSKVSVTGHSLGGSVAELFAACANSGRVLLPEFIQQSWPKGTAERLPEWGDQPHVVLNDWQPGA